MNLFRGLALPSLLLFVLLLLVSADSIWALDPSQPMSSYIRDHIGVQKGRCLSHSAFPVLKSSELYAVN